MKKLLFAAFSLLVISLFAGCDKKDEKASVTLNFKANYNGQALVKYQKYDFGNPAFPITFSRFRTFLSDVELVKSDGSTVLLTDVAEVDFFPDNATTENALAPSVNFDNIEVGDYKAIRFGIGVKPQYNGKQPKDFAIGNPLSKETEYWPSWKSWIFTKIEGQADANNNGEMDVFMQYHTGSDPVYKTYTIEKPISVNDTGGNVTMSFDLRKVFINTDGTFYDIVTYPATPSSITKLDVHYYIADGLARSITIE